MERERTEQLGQGSSGRVITSVPITLLAHKEVDVEEPNGNKNGPGIVELREGDRITIANTSETGISIKIEKYPHLTYFLTSDQALFIIDLFPLEGHKCEFSFLSGKEFDVLQWLVHKAVRLGDIEYLADFVDTNCCKVAFLIVFEVWRVSDDRDVLASFLKQLCKRGYYPETIYEGLFSQDRASMLMEIYELEKVVTDEKVVSVVRWLLEKEEKVVIESFLFDYLISLYFAFTDESFTPPVEVIQRCIIIIINDFMTLATK